MVIETIPRSFGFLYGLVMTVVCAWLWYSGRWRQTTGWLLLIISSALGFLIFSPVMPYQFEQLVLQNEQALESPLAVALAGFSVTLALAFLFGRFFCGYLCPAGALQELVFRVAGRAPPRKIHVRQKTIFMTIRAACTILFLLLACTLSYSLLALFGIRDFFWLLPAAGTAVFALVLVIGTQVYRPFCRLVCPAGLLFSLASWKGVFRLRRTGACIRCKKCEKACPADEARKDDKKAECYLCGRCMDVCPSKGAIRYCRAMPESKPGREE